MTHLISHIVVTIDHKTGEMETAVDTQNIEESGVFDADNNEWLSTDEMTSEVFDVDAKLIEDLQEVLRLHNKVDLLKVYELLEEIYNEIKVGDGEMSYEMFVKVRNFFGDNIEDDDDWDRDWCGFCEKSYPANGSSICPTCLNDNIEDGE